MFSAVHGVIWHGDEVLITAGTLEVLFLVNASISPSVKVVRELHALLSGSIGS